MPLFVDMAPQAFDAAFARRAPRLDVRQEEPGDVGFLIRLFTRCSPLHDVLPRPMLEHQAQMQHDHYAGAFPFASRRIVSTANVPIGRMIIDWWAGEAHGIDLAVDPAHRASGAGLHLLRAWLETADAFDLPCRLTVRAENPARRIFARLGFAEEHAFSAREPLVRMKRGAHAARL